MRLLVPLILSLFFLSPSTGWSQKGQAVEIYLKHQESIIKDLGDYLDNNPDAPDREAALLFLTNTLNALGKSKESLARYEELFELMRKRETISLTMVQSMVELYAQTGQRDKGIRLVWRVNGMFPEQANDPQFQQLIYALENRLNRPLIGETLEIAFKDLNGNQVDLAEMKNRIVLIHFWSPVDQASLAQLPDLARLRRQYAAKGFEILGIAVDENRQRVEQVVRERNITWPQFCDGKAFDGKFTDKYHIRSVPASYLIGKDGTILRTDVYGPQLAQLLGDILN